MALLSLAGYLLKNQVSTQIIDITPNTIVKNKSFLSNYQSQLTSVEAQILTKYQNNPSPVVGITCYTPEYFEVLTLAKKIKQINPKVFIVVGGIHPTLFTGQLLCEPNSPIDCEVVGEGEATLLELVNHLLSSTNWKKCLGIAYKSSRKPGFIVNPLRPLVTDLDSLYSSAYHLIDMDYYTSASPYSIRGCYLRSFYLLATRGCPSSCTFCVAKHLRSHNGGGSYTRVRSAVSLFSEIKLLKDKYKIDSFYFIDDLFTINKDNVTKFCNLLSSHYKNSIVWGCSSKVSTLNEDLIKRMAASGCIQIDFGVERGSNDSLKAIQKGQSIEMVETIFKLCHRYHIRTFANYLVNLPGETETDLTDILNFNRRLKPEVVSLNVFTPYPGTDIYVTRAHLFTKTDYPNLTHGSDHITSEPSKYLFANHSVDLSTWANFHTRTLNPILPYLSFHLSLRYLKLLLHSGRLSSYLSGFKSLVLEFLNLKLRLG